MLNINNLFKTLVTFTFVATVFVALPANASVVQFNSAGLNTTFADGTFSTNLSGLYNDGFYNDSPTTNNTSAFNGYGQNGEYILFNMPVLINSRSLRKDPGSHRRSCLPRPHRHRSSCGSA